MDLIDRYRKWKLMNQNESDSDSDGSDDPTAEDPDSDWDIGTIRDPSADALATAAVTAGLQLSEQQQQHGHQNGGSLEDGDERPLRLAATTMTAGESSERRNLSPVRNASPEEGGRLLDGSPLRDLHLVAPANEQNLMVGPEVDFTVIISEFSNTSLPPNWQPNSVAENRYSRSVEKLHLPRDERPDRSLAAATAANAAAAAASALALQQYRQHHHQQQQPEHQQQQHLLRPEDERRTRQQHQEHRWRTVPSQMEFVLAMDILGQFIMSSNLLGILCCEQWVQYFHLLPLPL